LVSTDSSHPILLPVVDSLNHARARVSWVVSGTQPKTPPSQSGPLELETRSQISLVIHSISPANTEVFNNYGPKPNSELILGYGFSLPSNPDDTIVLKIGGPGGATASQRWEVGRDARGAEGLWKELKALFDVGSDHGEEIAAEWELDLEAAETLKEMVENKLEALPELPEKEPEGVRGEVWSMVQQYVQGAFVFKFDFHLTRSHHARPERRFTVSVLIRGYKAGGRLHEGERRGCRAGV
jgi:hypothetical protein